MSCKEKIEEWVKHHYDGIIGTSLGLLAYILLSTGYITSSSFSSGLFLGVFTLVITSIATLLSILYVESRILRGASEDLRKKVERTFMWPMRLSIIAAITLVFGSLLEPKIAVSPSYLTILQSMTVAVICYILLSYYSAFSFALRLLTRGDSDEE